MKKLNFKGQKSNTISAQITTAAFPNWCLKIGASLELGCWTLGALLVLVPSASAQQPFQFPTANHALFDTNAEDKFFVGTVGKPWTSGCFGCVRSEGWQM